MKKFLLLAAAAAMIITSCNKEPLGGRFTGNTGDRLIGISPQASVTTRAAIDGTTFPDDRTMLMSAYYNAEEGASGNYFQQISFAKSGSSWVADKYWPQNGSLDLLAVSYDTLAITNIAYGGKVSDSLSFDVPDNSTMQCDIMHGSAAAQTYSAAGTPMVMKHAEAVLVWSAGATVAYDATNNLGITINKITLKDAKYSGNLAVTAAEDADNGYCIWSNLGTQKDLNLLNSASGKGDTLSYNVPATAMDITSAGNHMGIGGIGIIVPEQAQTSFVVYYTQHNGKDASGNALNTDLQYTYNCSGEWFEGLKYNYVISFNVNKVQVNPSIVDWVTEPAVGITIPEPVAATYSVSAGTSVNLPKAVLALNSEVMVNWGDGSAEAFTNDNVTRSSMTVDTLSLSHSYGAAYTGLVSIVVRRGSMNLGEIEKSEFAKFNIIDGAKFIAQEKLPLLSGVFTVCASPLKKVRFAKGNLMANVNAEGTAVTEWKIAEHQYDYVGNTTAQQQCKGGWVDLFGWTPAGKYSDGVKQYGINTSTTGADYVKDGITDQVCDWGSLIKSGLTVLTDSEWQYLISNKLAPYPGDETPFTVAGINGAILKPDGFSGTVNDSYTAEEWVSAEAEGLVFIPFAGCRYGSSVDDVGGNGYCWSSTPNEDEDGNAYSAYFYTDASEVNLDGRYIGYSVRLVSVQE